MSDTNGFRVIRSRRRTLALEISRQGEVLVRAPLRASDEAISRFVNAHRGWLGKAPVPAKRVPVRPPRADPGAGAALEKHGRVPPPRPCVPLGRRNVRQPLRHKGYSRPHPFRELLCQGAFVLFSVPDGLPRRGHRIRGGTRAGPPSPPRPLPRFLRRGGAVSPRLAAAPGSCCAADSPVLL